MDRLAADASPTDLLRAVVENARELNAAMVRLRGAERVPLGEGAGNLHRLPFPLLNWTVHPRFQRARFDTDLGRFLAEADRRAVPLVWWLTPGSEPADLAARLPAHGFVHRASMPGMARCLDRLPAGDPPEDVVVRLVSSADIPAWADVVLRASGFPEEMRETLHHLVVDLGYEEHSDVHNFVAWREGRPVAASTVFYGAGVAGLYNIGTIQEARGHGLGRAVTLATMQAARARGYEFAVLHSSALGLPVYRRLGFKICCTVELFTRPVSTRT